MATPIAAFLASSLLHPTVDQCKKMAPCDPRLSLANRVIHKHGRLRGVRTLKISAGLMQMIRTLTALLHCLLSWITELGGNGRLGTLTLI